MPLSKTTVKSQQEAIDWVLKLRSKDCSLDDKQQFLEWVTQNPEHSKLYAHFDAQWLTLNRFKGVDFPSRQRALSYRSKFSYRQKQSILFSITVSLLLVIGLTGFRPDGWYGIDAHYKTERGNRYVVTLEDGSRLELNGDTEIKTHLSFWRRSVELVRGEVFFSVVHETDRPFVVTAGNGRIVDLGTEFEVYLQPKQVVVAVQEGSVRVQTHKSQELIAGQILSYENNGNFVTEASDNVETITAWRNGLLIFNNRNLDEVLAEINRYNNIQVRLANQTLGKLKVSGRFHIDRLDSAIDTIASTLPVTIRRLNVNQLEIRSYQPS